MENWTKNGTVRLKCYWVGTTANGVRRRYFAGDRFTLISWDEQQAKVCDSSGQRVLLPLAELDYLGFPDPNDDGPGGGAEVSWPPRRVERQLAT